MALSADGGQPPRSTGTLARGYRRLSAWSRAKIAAHRPLPDERPLIVYTLRKVGSTSIVRTLRDQGLTVYKHHCIHPPLNARFQAALRELGAPPQHWLEDGMAFHRRMDKWRRRGGERCRLVVLVKDPIAVALSDFFMQLFEFMPREVERRGLDDLPRLMGAFQHVMTLDPSKESDPLYRYLRMIVDLPKIWFAEELQPAFGIDLLSTPFPMDRGFDIHHAPGADILLMRTEDLNQWGAPALNAFLGLELDALARANVTLEKAGGELYPALRQALRLPAAVVDAHYADTYVGHFYSPREIEAFRIRWVEGQ